MTSLSESKGRWLILWIGVGVLCLGLVTCAVPNESSSTPAPMAILNSNPPTTSMSTSKLTPRPAATSTLSPSAAPESGPDGSWALFEGCWGLETEEVSFEIRLQQEGLEVRGSFLFVKLCVVVDELSACRIREGTLHGSILSRRTSEVRLVIPEYDDEGVVRLTLSGDGGTLQWKELDYPTLGLADGEERYLPPSFALLPCGD